ncbi:hypothetical protein MG293_015059 [Ovis ammon polii]|uniref:Uncharacterized protein n=1 Tax=Ovis ammon polii TaxID=230172 RepID=A0AAD4TXR8_OVIAM|nr:hypothetical protein MG293_015059 [Ovis ammon polii]
MQTRFHRAWRSGPSQRSFAPWFPPHTDPVHGFTENSSPARQRICNPLCINVTTTVREAQDRLRGPFLLNKKWEKAHLFVKETQFFVKEDALPPDLRYTLTVWEGDSEATLEPGLGLISLTPQATSSSLWSPDPDTSANGLLPPGPASPF